MLTINKGHIFYGLKHTFFHQNLDTKSTNESSDSLLVLKTETKVSDSWGKIFNQGTVFLFSNFQK